MKNSYSHSEGISETVSIILVISLVLILAIVLYALLFGSVSLKNTSRVAATAGTVIVPETSIPIMYSQPSAGDNYYLLGQQNIPSGYPVVYFMLRDPTGTSIKTTQTIKSPGANTYGTALYLYKDTSGYHVTDSAEMIAFNRTKIRPFTPQGTWTLTMVDKTADVPLTDMKVLIGAESPSYNPLGGSMTWTNFGQFINKTGYLLPFTSYNVGNFTGPGGMKAFSFNGVSSYIQGVDNPDVSFTGNMGISLWLQPSTTTGYHEILGKGTASDTNDNYDLFIIDRTLWFEWTQEGTSPAQMYHIQTAPLTWDKDWKYVTFNVNNGVPEIYYDGVSVPFNYYAGNTPGGVPLASAVPVDLKPDNNPVTIGRQNWPGNYLYYAGNMSEVTYYNRALSASEVADNKATYQT
ncbi:MAG: LamG domain-containing protein [Methanomicrobiales archaeon]|nr:LamG domain-containing protein [Methanomicrobiales archaeon]